MNLVHLSVLALAVSVGVGPAAASPGNESTPELLASQLRTQGYACSKPKSATHERHASHPNEEVWILRCEDGAYRMTVIPDMAAKVEKLRDHNR